MKMDHDKRKYVADSRYFRGDVLTVMSDGVHCDDSGHTLTELREKENNPHLYAFGRKELRKKGRIYMESLCTLFREVPLTWYEEQFYYSIRRNRNYFFNATPYYRELHDFYFKVSGRCFTGIRPVNLPHEELQRQIGEHYRRITRKPDIRKWNIVSSGTDGSAGRMGTAYFFVTEEGRQRFICNLTASGETEESILEARKDVARTLRSLRRHHYTYFAGMGGTDNLDRFMDDMEKNDYTLLAAGTFFQYPTSRESVTLTGKIKETGKRFLYRIYDREVFLHLLKRLRGVKKETEHTERVMT